MTQKRSAGCALRHCEFLGFKRREIMAGYNHTAIEKKWRENWEKNPINVNDGKKPKYYCLDMFPYPSGSGLHVGHWRGYVISDVWSRYQILKGHYVIHPMGWDAFGLPAENYAIKMGFHPAISTEANIKNIKRSILPILDFINGPSGSSFRCSRRAWHTRRNSRSTGVHPVRQVWRMKRLSTDAVSVVVQL